MNAEIRGRYDPNFHNNPQEYIAEGRTFLSNNARRSLVLAGLFTPLAEALHDGIMLKSTESGLFIPDELSGDEPAIFKKFARGNEKDHLRGELAYYHSWGHLIRGKEAETLRLEIPVGGYGRDLAWAITQAARALYSLTPEMVQEDAEKLYRAHAGIIERNTFYHDPLMTMFDGVKSTAEAFALLTIRRSTRYINDPVGLLRGLIQEETFDEFGHSIVQGKQAEEMIAHAIIRARPIEGKTLGLNPTFRQDLKDEQKWKAEGARLAEDNFPTNEGQTFVGCPLAFKDTPVKREDGTSSTIMPSGITLVAKTLIEYVDHYYQAKAA